MSKVKTWEEYSEEEILKANIEKYDKDEIVEFYADFEEPKYSYIEYTVIFNAVLKFLHKHLKHTVRAVDMCGGAGKAAFALKSCDPDCEVTLVDLADKMLDIARRKAEKDNIACRIVLDDAFSFLGNEEEEFDLIVFSSALHHFKDPVSLLEAAAKRLSPQGLIISIADPNTKIKSKRFRFLQFMASNSQLKKIAIKNCLNELFRSSDKKAAGAENFDVAEYQTRTGINDIKLSNDIKRAGLAPLVHIRYPAGEPAMTKIMPWLGLCWAFSMVMCQEEEFINYDGGTGLLKKEIKQELPYRVNFLI
ncbi:MAG TPA: class I SAM-dependent methyltransferase [Syntrophomonadaceae bacterium]|nr:class I SAM-dependent methyltransferase [Syntrophomonadaceae bacterium]HPR93226.1 class I SAM-dependent methyltransferase [Syntrophomonadaceae bacterium]